MKNAWTDEIDRLKARITELQNALADNDEQYNSMKAHWVGVCKGKDETINSIITLSQHQYDVQNELEKEKAFLLARNAMLEEGI